MKRQGSDEEQTSDLPDDVLGVSVISRLSLRDAVHTSLVSSTWRPLFTFRSHLCLDWHAFFTLPHKYQKCIDFGTKYRLGYCSCIGYSIDFVERVNQFLKAYSNHDSSSSTSLTTFKINFCVENLLYEYINQWATFALQRGVRKLVLNISCHKSSPGQTQPGDYESYYTFGSRAQRHIVASRVEDLELRTCILHPNIISQLFGTSLRSLKLTNVPLGREEVLHAICSCCSKLQSLVLKRSRLPQVVRISNHKLETLSIRHCFGFEEVEFEATNLARFEYFGVTLVHFSFRRVPNLRNMCLISQSEIDLYQMLNELAKDVPAMDDLAICAERASLETFIIPTFRHVEQLKLCLTQTRNFDMMRVINILRAFPLLNKLHLAISCIENVERGEKIIALESVHKHLKDVEISGFRGTKNQIEFVINLLKFAALSLKSLVIKPQMQVLKRAEKWELKGRDSWDGGEREKVVEALQDHLSSKDKLIFIG